MSKVIILQGLPASGKTTWAKEQVEKSGGNIKRINKDDLRAMLDGGKWSKGNEKFVLYIRDWLIEKAVMSGFSVIVDDTNLHPKHIDNIKNLVKAIQHADISEIKVETKSFDVSLEECIERDKKRPNPVGEKVIRDMYNQYLKPPRPKIEFDPSLPNCIICDLDGTLALIGNRDPYDASSCENDEVNTPIKDMLIKYTWNGLINVLFVSGREKKYADQTNRWLENKAEMKRYGLLMRKTGDYRKDSVIKEELYREFIENRFNVLFVLDDRNQVVDMWRSLGLTCLQVAEGNF